MAKSVGSIHEVRRKMAKTHELISTSYHEAGHTIYCLLKFFKVDLVSIFENVKEKRIWGKTIWEPISELSDIKEPELFDIIIDNEICMNYAGLIAEKHHFKKTSGSDKFPMVLKNGSEEDTMEAAVLIRQYNLAPPGQKRYIFKQKLIKKTLNNINEHWDAVTIVAHALFEKKRLNFLDLKNILTKKSNNKEFWKEQFKMINFIFDNFQSLDEKEIINIIS